MNRVYLFFILTLFITACANPDYVTPEDLQEHNQSKPSEKCSLSFPKVQICADIQWVAPPVSSQAGELTVNLSSQYSGSFSALLWMPSMGHGSAPVKIESTGPGQYHITNMYFIMPGDWEVRMFLKNSSGEVIDQLFIPLMVP